MAESGFRGRVRARVRQWLGAQDREIARLSEEITALRFVVMRMSTMLTEKLMDPKEVHRFSQQAWVNARPDAGLTWNVEMTGDEFISNVTRHAGDDLGRVLEIGPGYGRLMASMLSRNVRFAEYVGVDISAENIRYLSDRFGNGRTRYEHADFFKFTTPGPFDCILSSAVFMHFYPTVKPAMMRCRELLRPGGRLLFDVPSGSSRFVDPANRLYVCEYRGPADLPRFAQAAGFSRCTVEEEPGFGPGIPGWFVCALR